jgi:hypothetical protein
MFMLLEILAILGVLSTSQVGPGQSETVINTPDPLTWLK